MARLAMLLYSVYFPLGNKHYCANKHNSIITVELEIHFQKRILFNTDLSHMSVQPKIRYSSKKCSGKLWQTSASYPQLLKI